MDEWDYDNQQEYNDYLASVGTLDGWPPMDPPEDHADSLDEPEPCDKFEAEVDDSEACKFCGFNEESHLWEREF